jgi:hypothetical protein
LQQTNGSHPFPLVPFSVCFAQRKLRLKETVSQI